MNKITGVVLFTCLLLISQVYALPFSYEGVSKSSVFKKLSEERTFTIDKSVFGEEIGFTNDFWEFLVLFFLVGWFVIKILLQLFIMIRSPISSELSLYYGFWASVVLTAILVFLG